MWHSTAQHSTAQHSTAQHSCATIVVPHLADLCCLYDDKAVSELQESMEQEGQHLAKASFGPTILLSIGKAYERQAAIHLGGFFQGSLVSLKQEGHSIKSKVQSLARTPDCNPSLQLSGADA